jgi:superfamily I DNA/RNA helicase
VGPRNGVVVLRVKLVIVITAEVAKYIKRACVRSTLQKLDCHGKLIKKWKIMKTLPRVRATPEQLPLISQNRFGVEVIRGAAGSGKTSTALLRLRSLVYLFAARHEREQHDHPVKVLVLTFNRTLAGYINSLAEHQVENDENVEISIDTFSRWAMVSVGSQCIVDKAVARNFLKSHALKLGALTADYLVKEAEYLMGRFEPENLENYILSERTGRGLLPRVERSLRRRILDEIVYPYLQWLNSRNEVDWNSLAIMMARLPTCLSYDIVVVDESQDFSSNELRAIRRHLATSHSVTFVIDTAQRVYARAFAWSEAGFDVRPERYHTLQQNYRNTIEIATFAAGVLIDINLDADGALPNLHTAVTRGPKPIVLQGLYSSQTAWAVNYIESKVDLATDSVAFLKPRGGTWFVEIAKELDRKGIKYVDITRESEWPGGDENIALSTFHSAKGLEFDYVFILGLSNRNTPFDKEEQDDEVIVLRRLLAIAVARARKAVVLGYKPGEESRLIQFFTQGTFDEVAV